MAPATMMVEPSGMRTGTGCPMVTGGFTLTTRRPVGVEIVAVMASRTIFDSFGAALETLRMTAKNWCRTPKPFGMTRAAGMLGRRWFGFLSRPPLGASGPPRPSSSSSNGATPGGSHRGGICCDGGGSLNGSTPGGGTTSCVRLSMTTGYGTTTVEPLMAKV